MCNLTFTSIVIAKKSKLLLSGRTERMKEMNKNQRQQDRRKQYHHQKGKQQDPLQKHFREQSSSRNQFKAEDC